MPRNYRRRVGRRRGPSQRRPRAVAAAAEDRVRAGRIYEPAGRDDGARVLIMRLWPRGVRKERITVWLKELGPVVPLLRDFLDERIDWPTYRRRYLAGLARPEAQEHIERVLGLAREGRVTLLCGCADERRCHRSLLRGYLSARLL